MPDLGIFKAVGEQGYEAFNAAFVDAALRNKTRIEKALIDRFRLFFKDMHSFIGVDKPPGVLGVSWDNLTPDWAKRKKVGQGNAFYHGRTGRFKSTILRKDPVVAYGAPRLKIQLGAGGPPIDPQGGHFQRAFYKDLRISIDSFPKIQDETELSKVFSGRTSLILGKNESFSEEQASFGRPFLGPMYDYYSRVVLPRVFFEEMNK